MRVIVIVGICVLTVIELGAVTAAVPEVKGKNDSIELKGRTIGDKDLVEMTFGDVCFVATELTFLHADGSKTTIRANGHNVELENGSINMSAKKLQTVFPGGILSRRNQNDVR